MRMAWKTMVKVEHLCRLAVHADLVWRWLKVKVWLWVIRSCQLEFMEFQQDIDSATYQEPEAGFSQTTDRLLTGKCLCGSAKLISGLLSS